MERKKFQTSISANPERVWEVLWEDAHYREWTSVFCEGSHAVSDWREGSKILFLSPEGEGMASKIAKLVPHEFMSFHHLGIVKAHQEIYDDPEAKQWAGAEENYSLKPITGGVTLTVEMDLTPEYQSYFETVWPKALDKVKEIAERSSRNIDQITTPG